MQKIFYFVGFFLALASALPIVVEDDLGQQYFLEPVRIDRERRALNWQPEPPQPGKLSGEGGFNGHQGGGGVQYEHPNGAKASVGYSHANGWGHDASVDYSHPVWSNGKTSVNLGGGFSGHTGGFWGTHGTDRRVGASISHRW